MAASKVGGGRIAAVIVTVVAVAAMQVPGVSCRLVPAAAPSGVGEAEQCVRRCATEMLACASAACASSSVRVAASASRRGGGGEGSGAACGGGCQNEYLGCIDVC